jgi:competence protein ComEC
MVVLQFPLTRITIAFVLGVVFDYYFHLTPNCIVFLVALSFAILSLSFFAVKKRNSSFIYFDISVYLVSFIIGIATLMAHTDSYQKENYTHYKELFKKPHRLSIVVNEKLKSTLFNHRFVVILKQIDNTACSGKIILNVKKEALDNSLEIGDCLRFSGMVYKNKASLNPSQFDYSKYLQNKQIYAQLYCSKSEINIGLFKVKDIWYYTSKFRSIIIRNLEKKNFNTTELNVAIALIMGQQQEISPDIIKDYQYAGAVHILSVSGLHIGFILYFVRMLLKSIPNTKRGLWFKLVCIITALFAFGLIAGLAPSVVRSVVMFSFVAVGDTLRRQTNVYHTLLVSILLILLFQPYFLFDVGFQLSYLALFFIVWVKPLFDSLWTPRNAIGKFFWDILSVSFAAQLGTLPLSIYYFHQFPCLFFVTNLIVIPILVVVMILGVVVFIMALFDVAPLFLVQLFEYCIYFMNRIINIIASFEQFIIQKIPLNGYILIFGYTLLIAIVIWLKKPTFNRLIFLLMSVVFLQLSYININWSAKNELIVFHQKKQTLIAERKGNNVVVYCNEINNKKVSKNSVLNSYLVGNFCTLKSKEKLRNLMFFRNRKILIVDSTNVYLPDMKPDIVILIMSPKINLQRLLQTLRPKTVIADGTNHGREIKAWETSCRKAKINFHATVEKGFFSLQ